ncbi:MAG: hypothetical protein RLZZ399_2087, partial [Verrucomicrobiota bacterium]
MRASIPLGCVGLWSWYPGGRAGRDRPANGREPFGFMDARA